MRVFNVFSLFQDTGERGGSLVELVLAYVRDRELLVRHLEIYTKWRTFCFEVLIESAKTSVFCLLFFSKGTAQAQRARVNETSFL